MFKIKKERGIQEGELVSWKNMPDRPSSDMGYRYIQDLGMSVFTDFLCIKKLGNLIYLLPLKSRDSGGNTQNFVHWTRNPSHRSRRNAWKQGVPDIYLAPTDDFRRVGTGRLEQFVSANTSYSGDDIDHMKTVVDRINYSFNVKL